ISEAVLDSARAGIYGSYSIRNVSDDVLREFFTKENHHYRISPKLKSMVRFQRINLIDKREVGKIRGMDVIFCRNVLIYFDDKAKHRAVANLYDSLRPGGYLIIGTSESLHNITRAFRPVIINRVIVYQKV
ncbi:MAG TPA: CheR family methyltransferase, partial [Dissulfurispiraceae bacterium]|nr:CheR family methyltransferase [Dissulfurispiraceae bacterium]